MIALEVYINGVKVCTASEYPGGTLSAGVTRVHLMARRSIYADENDRVLRDATCFSVGGILHHGETRQHTNWATRDLSVGDEITIRVVDVEAADPPAELYPVDDEDVRQMIEARFKKIRDKG